MQFRIFPVTPFEQNCTLLWCEETRGAALVDPGGDAQILLDAVRERSLQLERILLTHGHIDHVGAAAEIATAFDLPIEGPHREDEYWLQALPDQSRMFGFAPTSAFTPDRWLTQGDRVAVGHTRLEVLHCPGHTPGHLVFYLPAQKLALVGDVLFKGSIGRTDLPGGNQAELLRSIREQLWPLGDDVSFIPGHGPMSSLGDERRDNPFVGIHAA